MAPLRHTCRFFVSFLHLFVCFSVFAGTLTGSSMFFHLGFERYKECCSEEIFFRAFACLSDAHPTVRRLFQVLFRQSCSFPPFWLGFLFGFKVSFNFLDSKGARECKSDRSRQEFSNEYLVTKFGCDTAENESSK